MRYVDLTQGAKPHLLIKSANNLGSETYFHYAPSTKFYQLDRLAGKPWITRLSFPVHCVERVEVVDHISKSRFEQRYAYHHGYFDGREREFGGFAMVEQWDTEVFERMVGSDALNVNAAWHVPPTYTKSWFHTGAFIEKDKISRQLAQEYFGAPLPADSVHFDQFLGMLLEDTVLASESLSTVAMEEACRGLRGKVLRTEIYAQDATSKSFIPYKVSEKNYTIVALQEQPDSHGCLVVRVDSREALSYDYEQNLQDPRIAHQMTLQVDEYGNILRAVKIAYGRAKGMAYGIGKSAQETSVVMYDEADVTNAVLDAENHQLPKVSEARSYQIYGLERARYELEDFRQGDLQAIDGFPRISFDKWNGTGGQGKRLVSKKRTIYRSDDLSKLLEQGELQSMARQGESYTLAITPEILTTTFHRGSTDGSPSPEDMLRGGYADLDEDGNWWIPSGRTYFAPSSVTDELEEARTHFYLARRYRNPFGQDSTSYYDHYDLLVSRSVDALDNENRAENDYRLLRPFLVIDENGNRKQCTFDLLGYVIGVAVMGKAGQNLGDSLETFQTNISEDQLNSLLESPRGAAAADSLGSATSMIIYCSDNYYRNRKPVFNISISRETHVSDNEPLKTQIAFTYLDGLGREVQKKAQAEAGDVRGQPVNVRWITSGWKIYNNKGSPVREYEPFFDDTHAFKYDERFGVSTTNIYDPLARVVAKILPNHSWTKSVYHPWELKLFDGNDTVLMNPADDPDVGAFVSRLPRDDYLPTWYQGRIRGQMGPENRKAAEKTRDHADTPAIMQSDPLGRVIVSIADNGRFGKLASFRALDIQGNARELTDPLGRIIERNMYSMTGICLCKESMDARTNWKLQDVANNTILAWDSRAHAFKTVYDALRRPLEVWMSNSGQPMTKIGSYVYGESEQDQTSAIQHNKRGRLVEVRDQAGLLVHDRYDFKGNGVKRRRFFAQEYKAVLDWSIPVPLEESHHAFEQKFDAMNRLMEDKTPDGTCTTYTYNEGGLLEQTRLDLRGGESDTDSQNWPAYLMAAEYNAKRQRTRVTLGSGVVTSYQYDEFTFRTTDIVSKQGSDRLQSLHYTYDPIGNIVNTRDDSQQTIYFRNQVVEPSAEYTYDATYQLIEATGREHVGQAGRQPFDAFDRHNMTTEHPSNGNAMARYTEAYSYDAAGNLLACRHRGTDNSQPGWTRKFAYEEDSRLEPGRKSNRLSHCMVGQARESFEYDGHGNMTKMPHLEVLEWDHRDQLKAVAQQRGGGNVTHYVYDHEGNRVRKVTEQDGVRVRERLYLGLLEIGRKYTGSGELVLERETLHVFDDRNRIAVIDTRTVGDEPNVPSKVVRYQLHDLLGSAVVELDSGGLVISYEEYSPFGSTTYQSVPPGRTNRYRYIGKERDKESGLYCNGARYFAPWLCRWTSPDPVGASEDGNLFRYAGNRPLTFKDPSGLASKGNQEYIDVFMEIWKESKKRANIDKPITAASTKGEKAAHGISGHNHSIDVAKDLNENASGAMAKYKGRIYAGVVVNKETMTVTKIFATGHSSNGYNLDAVIMPEGMTLKVGQKLDFGGADATADFKFSGGDRIQNNHVKFAKDGHGYTVNEGGGWQKSPKPPKNGGGSGGGGEGGSPPPDAHTAPVETPPSASKGADALHQTSAPDALHSFHPKASTAEIAGESALKAAGKSTAKTVGSKVLKALPLIGDIVGGAMSVDSIADAAPENRARVAAEEAGGYLGGEIGGVVGGMLLVGAAVAVGVSPVGWVAAGVGVVGAIAGGVGGDMAGRAVVDWF